MSVALPMSKRFTEEELAKLREIAEAATPGPLTMHLCDDARYAAFVDAPHLGPDAPELAVFLIERDARFFAEFDRDTVLALLDEIERLRQTVDALQLDRRTLEDVISVLEQEQRRAGRYLEDARDELAHGKIHSAEHRIIDALVSLSSKERCTDTRLQTVVKSGGGGETGGGERG